MSAMAASDSPPCSVHSAVALETVQAPQNGESQSTDSADVSGANDSERLRELIYIVINY